MKVRFILTIIYLVSLKFINREEEEDRPKICIVHFRKAYISEMKIVLNMWQDILLNAYLPTQIFEHSHSSKLIVTPFDGLDKIVAFLIRRPELFYLQYNQKFIQGIHLNNEEILEFRRLRAKKPSIDYLLRMNKGNMDKFV